MNLSTPTNPKPKSPLKILLIGPPGSRKTTLMLQFPSIHVLDCDGNLDGPERTIRQLYNPSLSYSYDTIYKDDEGKPVEIEDCYNRIDDKLKLFRNDEAYKSRKWVGLDSLSHVNEITIRHTLKQQKKSNKSLEMEGRDWSPFKSFSMVLLVSRLESTGKNIICTAHEERIYEANPQNFMVKTLKEINPYYQGSVGDNIAYLFTDCWKLEKRQAPGKIENWLLTDRTPTCECLKNSIGLPKELNVTDGFKVIEPYLKDYL